MSFDLHWYFQKENAVVFIQYFDAHFKSINIKIEVNQLFANDWFNILRQTTISYIQCKNKELYKRNAEIEFHS